QRQSSWLRGIEAAFAHFGPIGNNFFGNNPDQRWVILAIAPLDQTLTPLGHIRQTLLTFLLALTFALIAATMVAILLIAREMARPVEQLRDDVLREEKLYVTERITQNFKIAEFNQLAGAINSMIRRLISWAEELEGAWKEAQLANQLKSEFLSTVSHNLRTPLNGIIGSLQILMDGYCDTREEELEFLDKAKQSTLYLKRIIDDILDLSQLEKGKLDVEMDRVPLTAVLEEAIALQDAALKAKNLTISFHAWPEPVVVHADRDKLRQVFLSILDNAIKFTPQGEIKITTNLTHHQPDLPLANGSVITQDLHSPSGQLAIITIQDPGVGVAPEQQAKLFRPFVLVHAASGAGLGLAIARNLMDLMGGAIELASPGVNQGTTVTLYLATAQRSGGAIGG
ncbi:MAG: sensor histidine kinase, partial [Spirulina sp. DLM2.Bin59]